MEKGKNVCKREKDDKKESEKKRLERVIYSEGRRARLLEQLQVEFSDIGKSVNRCIELVSNAIDGDSSNALFEDLLNANRISVNELNAMIESDTLNIKKNIEITCKKRKKLDEE